MLLAFSDIDHKKDAVIQCVKVLGLKNPENVIEEGNGIFSHTNTRGRKKYFIPFLTYKQYSENCNKYPNASLHRCIGHYVLYGNYDKGVNI